LKYNKNKYLKIIIMGKQNREILKTYFNKGDRPSEDEFSDLIDSGLNAIEDKATVLDTETGTNDEKFITPLGLKTSISKFAPVKKVNGTLPDANGEVIITNLSGSATTISGSIAKSQVTELESDLNSKQPLLVSGTNIKTINGVSILGTGDIAVSGGGGAAPAKLMAILISNFSLANVNTVQTAFPAACDTFTLEPNKTYLFKGKYLMGSGSVSHTTSMGWSVTGLTVSSMEYVTKTFSSTLNTQVPSSAHVQVSGTALKVLNASSAATTTTIEFEGILRTGAGNGTITPQIAFSALPNGTNVMKASSFIEFTELGSNTLEKIGAVS
jgi:hypothetical protein